MFVTDHVLYKVILSVNVELAAIMEELREGLIMKTSPSTMTEPTTSNNFRSTFLQWLLFIKKVDYIYGGLLASKAHTVESINNDNCNNENTVVTRHFSIPVFYPS